jgi:spore coat protein CotH
MDKKLLRVPLTAVFLAIFYHAFSQPSFPSNFPVFDSSVVARVDITINPDTLEWLYDNVESDIEFHATFKFDNGTINETLDDIGFRLRGNTSRYSRKKSFKVSFNTFESGREFYGLEKMNLNGEHNDPSIIRSRICWDWLRAFNIPAPRSTHAEVYINGNYYGLYIIVEHIDEEFAGSRFDNKDGNLYKCLYPADLKYLGSNPDLYKLSSGDRRVYDLRTNEEFDDYSDLAHFIDVLNNTPLNSLECELEKIFNLNDYLKVIAVDVITGNWDGYIYNKNNFYLYHNTKSGRIEYIPYDLDNTLGIDWLDRDWGTRNIYDWEQHNGEVRPLYTRLLDVPEIRARYSYYMEQLLDMLADEDSLFAYIDQIKGMISGSVVNDPYYPQDYGYSFASFLNSYNQALGGHVDYGLKPFIQTRVASALQQLQAGDIPPAVNHIRSSRAIPGEEYWVRAFVEDEDPAPVVRLQYRKNEGLIQFAAMYDDGHHHDREAGDGIYGCELSPFQFNETLSWQISASDNINPASLLPCSPVFISFLPSTAPRLFINELMADNDFTIADEYGEFDNWLELYNGDDEPVWLGDKYLSDNLANPDKWQLPDVTMQPGTFLIIWADGQPEQGPFHASYKLDDEGEELGIFDNETTGYFLIDSVSWGMQTIDISYGRHTDGGMPWVFFDEPTPGYSNTANSIVDNKETRDNIRFFPNPVTGGIFRFHDPFTGVMMDMMGRVMWRGNDAVSIDVSSYADGIYFLKDLEGNSAKVLVFD